LPGSTLLSSTVTFSWSTGPTAAGYLLLIGRSPGSSDYYDSAQTTTTSVTATNLPADGRTIYARLYTHTKDDSWPYNDYTYTASRGAKAEMLGPPNGSKLTSSAVTFSWTSGSSVSEYVLFVGNTVGGSDIYAQSQGTNRSGTIAGLPTDGRTLYVRLFSHLPDAWYWGDYTYAATTRPQVTVTFTNKLIYPANVYVNGSPIGTVPAGGTLSRNLDAPSSFTASYSLIQPAPFGVPLGDPMIDFWGPYSNPSGTYQLLINNQIGSQMYFAPWVTNQRSSGALMLVNGGLSAQNACNCVVPPFSSSVAFGYYRLFSTSNVRAYPPDSGYSGPYVFWGYDSVVAPGNSLVPLVQAGTGITLLTLTP
jgi:hypothetical protein